MFRLVVVEAVAWIDAAFDRIIPAPGAPNEASSANDNVPALTTQFPVKVLDVPDRFRMPIPDLTICPEPEITPDRFRVAFAMVTPMLAPDGPIVIGLLTVSLVDV